MSQETVEQTPALAASQASWRCVQAGDKEGWLALMTDDVVIEDPIGAAVHQPRRHRRASARTASRSVLRRATSGPTTITITCEETFPSSSPDEIAHILVLRFTFRQRRQRARCAASSPTRSTTPGCSTNLRGYWNMDMMKPVTDGKAISALAIRARRRRRRRIPRDRTRGRRAARGTGRGRRRQRSRRRCRGRSGATHRRRDRLPRLAGGPGDRRRADRQVHKEFGRIDILVNCAGTGGPCQRVDPRGDQRAVPRPDRRRISSRRSRRAGRRRRRWSPRAAARSSTPVRSRSSATTAEPATRRARAGSTA